MKKDHVIISVLIVSSIIAGCINFVIGRLFADWFLSVVPGMPDWLNCISYIVAHVVPGIILSFGEALIILKVIVIIEGKDF